MPKEYDDPANQSTKFPVVMVLPGQPSNPQDTMHAFDFPSYASHEIDTKKVKPFVAVFPPIMIAPPRDTECTDIPNGPQAETWLAKTVRQTVLSKFRVEPSGSKWSAMGFSTGGFCAAKVMLRNRSEFNAAVSVGGYFDAETDPTTGDLFGGSQQLRNENSPIWLVEQAPQTKTNLLIVVSKQDTDSWSPGAAYADSSKMIQATGSVPGVQSLVLPTGGPQLQHLHAHGGELPAVPRQDRQHLDRRRGRRGSGQDRSAVGRRTLDQGSQEDLGLVLVLGPRGQPAGRDRLEELGLVGRSVSRGH